MAKSVTTKAKIGKTTRPVMALLELLGRRWALRVLWELRGGALGFRELARRCEDVSPTSLTLRVRELSQAGLVESAVQGYQLTRDGRELGEKLLPLNRWAERWAT